MTLAAGDRKAQIASMLECCEGFTEKLSDWEVGFIDSITEQFTARGDLSEKQVEILERIYCRLP